ncbi:hypothetical protein AcV5_009847 [Taiwanofungus camphoratus]|nr:hypothetical protein AcV5_009847 [Antrodia cinnamomea]
MHLHCATAETIRISGSEPSRIAGPRNAGSGRVANVNVKDLEIPSASFDGKKRSRVGTIQVDEGMRYSGWKSRCGLNKEFLDLVFGVQISTLPPTHVKPRVLLWQSQDEGYSIRLPWGHGYKSARRINTLMAGFSRPSGLEAFALLARKYYHLSSRLSRSSDHVQQVLTVTRSPFGLIDGCLPYYTPVNKFCQRSSYYAVLPRVLVL